MPPPRAPVFSIWRSRCRLVYTRRLRCGLSSGVIPVKCLTNLRRLAVPRAGLGRQVMDYVKLYHSVAQAHACRAGNCSRRRGGPWPACPYRIRFGRSESLVLAPPRGLGPCCRLPAGADSGERRLPDGPSRDAAAGEDSSLIGRRLPVTAPERPAYRGAWPSHPGFPEVDPGPREPPHSRHPDQRAVASIAVEFQTVSDPFGPERETAPTNRAGRLPDGRGDRRELALRSDGP